MYSHDFALIMNARCVTSMGATRHCVIRITEKNLPLVRGCDTEAAGLLWSLMHHVQRFAVNLRCTAFSMFMRRYCICRNGLVSGSLKIEEDAPWELPFQRGRGIAEKLQARVESHLFEGTDFEIHFSQGAKKTKVLTTLSLLSSTSVRTTEGIMSFFSPARC